MRRIHVVAFKMAPKKAKSIEERDKTFSWTDDELSLLLKVVIDYKAYQASNGKDWETVKRKYEDIIERFLERYPSEISDASQVANKYPNGRDKSVFTKERVVSKIKKIKLGFRKAIDSGRRSGGGRVVTQLYDECLEIWSGSPAVESMKSGLESSVEGVDADYSEESRPHTPATVVSDEGNDDSASDVSSTTDQKKEDRRNLISHIKEKKDSRVTKKLSTENQLLALGKEELSLKRKMIEKMDESESKYQKTMETFAHSLSSLSATINSGFAMLGNILQQPSQAPNWQAPPHFMHDSQRYQSSMPSSYVPSDNTGTYLGDSNQYTKP